MTQIYAEFCSTVIKRADCLSVKIMYDRPAVLRSLYVISKAYVHIKYSHIR